MTELPEGSLYSERFLRALEAAARLHGKQRRKGSGVPYISHLLGTCAIALDYGADEDEAIAALLHDAIEDVEPTAMARQAVAEFGPRVLAIVEGCSDAETHPKPPWRERKERYIAHLADADASVLLVSAADKLHNARSIQVDHRRVGPEICNRFKATRDESIWYYRAATDAIAANPAHNPALVADLRQTVEDLERLP
jgi:GTP pyrophosphokinase